MKKNLIKTEILYDDLSNNREKPVTYRRGCKAESGFIIDSTKHQKWMLANGGGKRSQSHKLVYFSSAPGAQPEKQEEGKEAAERGNGIEDV